MDIIFDIDGTLANADHRTHFVRSKPKNWNAFNAAIPFDTVHEDVAWLLGLLYRTNNTILLASGRGEESRYETTIWLRNHSIYYHKLYMRPEKDYRDDTIIKKEMLDQMRFEGFDPKIVFDDRDKVVKMWRDNGLRCLQVAEGAF